MKTKKLKLKDFKVRSFITNFDNDTFFDVNTLKGGKSLLCTIDQTIKNLSIGQVCA